MPQSVLNILIPFYNEEKQIPVTLAEVRRVMEASGETYTVVAVDDGSSDGTWAAIRSASSADPRVRGLRLSRNFGKESALCAALDAADGDAVVVMDGDLQHPPRHIPEMVRLWREDGYDVVEGVKSDRGRESLGSKLSAKLFYGMFRRLAGIDLRGASDFKLMDRKVVEAWRRLPEHETFFRGMSAWLGFRRATIRFEVEERTVGTSKWSLGRLLSLSLQAIASFSARPLQAASTVGVLLVFLAGILAVQTLVNWLLGNAASGFTTVILLELLIGGCVLLSLGLLGVYIARIFSEVKGRPRYIVSETAGRPDGEETPHGPDDRRR
ncbi:MAG: glycosyltransferase family 2 protein [Clostridia bacterium]|nr:glycosyltransferase family 2 protein [Clostridia bacterium]